MSLIIVVTLMLVGSKQKAEIFAIRYVQPRTCVAVRSLHFAIIDTDLPVIVGSNLQGRQDL